MEQPKDFIRDIVAEDNKTGKFEGRVHTRFPPEPNGYLHIGHAKAFMLSYGVAKENNGKFNLRFDDTNPVKEEMEYVEGIIADVKWMGADFEDRLLFASDYFGQLYDYAEDLINKGKAYIDDQTPDEIKLNRGDFENPGKESPFRDRTIEQNLGLFRRMKAGEFADGERVLRAKIDMNHPNMNMRDPVIYRILHATHHNTGDEWCIYPMYDWAHGLEDSIEGITHSLCDISFENHRPLYDWFLDQLGVYHPQQIEFARLNMTYTVMSKRKILVLVDNNHISGWDDPRLPTLLGLRRRGYTPHSIADFLNRVGVAKKENWIAIELLEHCIREHLNKIAPRYMGVLDPLKVVIENLPEDHEEFMEAINNPEDETAGTRKVPFSRVIYIERDDFMEEPVKKFFRLAPGREVRLRYAYFMTCNDIVKDDAGNIIELRCTVDPETRGGNAPDGRRVKATMHWVSAKHAVDAEVRLYDKLFTVENPMAEDGYFESYVNKDSLEVRPNCKIEPAVKELAVEDKIQFERTGYFCVDKDTTPEKMVFNRTTGLRDTWAKVQKQQGK